MSHEAPRSELSDRASDGSCGVAAGAAISDYQTTLLRTIESTASDPRHLRQIVYELARMNLKREIWRADPPLKRAEVRECLQALEIAISRVEDDLSHGAFAGLSFPRLSADPVPLGNSPVRLEGAGPVRLAGDPEDAAPSTSPNRPDAEAAGPVGVALALRPRAAWSPRPEPALMPRVERRVGTVDGGTARPQVEIVYPARENPEMARLRRRAWLWFIGWPLVQLAVPIVLCFGLYFVLSRLGIERTQTRPVTVEDAPVATPSGLPLPSSYGVYAVDDGRLSELEALPIKAPDPRIMLSAEITKPSGTVLPDGKVVFVVFRRELVNSAPQKATVRVIARVAHVTTFEGGKPASANLQSSWRMRSNSYDYSVSPLSENREMIAIRPEQPDFVLPAGRYALIVNGFAYDFTVDGPLTDRAQCLESFSAVNGPVYTECRAN